MSPRAARWAVACALVALALAGSCAAQTLGQAPSAAGEAGFLWRWLAALGLCLGLGAAGALALRARLGAGGSGGVSMRPVWRALGTRMATRAPRRLEVLETVRASSTLEICLVRCDGREHLLAATANAVTQLDEPSRGVAQ